MKNKMYVHEVKLPGNSDFTKQFNYVSWLWGKATDKTLTPEQQKFYIDEHYNAKLCLEQGMPISYLNEYKG